MTKQIKNISVEILDKVSSGNAVSAIIRYETYYVEDPNYVHSNVIPFTLAMTDTVPQMLDRAKQQVSIVEGINE